MEPFDDSSVDGDILVFNEVLDKFEFAVRLEPNLGEKLLLLLPEGVLLLPLLAFGRDEFDFEAVETLIALPNKTHPCISTNAFFCSSSLRNLTNP